MRLDKEGNVKFKLGREKYTHWINKKSVPCLRKDCPHCKSADEDIRKVSLRMSICIVERLPSLEKGKPASGKNSVLQIYDAPTSLYSQIEADYLENGPEILGDTGVTYCVTYDATKSRASQYHCVSVPRDAEVLDIGDKLYWLDPTQAPKNTEDPVMKEKTDDVEKEVAKEDAKKDAKKENSESKEDEGLGFGDDSGDGNLDDVLSK